MICLDVVPDGEGQFERQFVVTTIICLPITYVENDFLKDRLQVKVAL